MRAGVWGGARVGPVCFGALGACLDVQDHYETQAFTAVAYFFVQEEEEITHKHADSADEHQRMGITMASSHDSCNNRDVLWLLCCVDIRSVQQHACCAVFYSQAHDWRWKTHYLKLCTTMLC